MRHETTDAYGTEVVLDMPNGMQLRTDGEDVTGVDYVRVCDPNGNEVAYWVVDEWACEEGGFVMGAIIGTLCAVEYADPSAGVDPMGPETAEGGLIGQQPY